MAERRVTSVLFGDLVGFTPLSESKDSEEVRELLSAYFQHCRVIVGRYGGVIEKFIGDAVMAVWGVPVAHEDDAERAVRAGLELVAMVTALGEEVGAPGLAQRVGIVTGEVAVTVGATAEGMVAGDAVNTAARVQSAAAPGQVWVDEATRGLASAAITFTDTGEHELKGKAEPVRLWQAGVVVSSVGGAQRVDGLEAPFTGRDADLRLVKELFHASQESGRPRLVVIDGEAGVGKSRLAWEFEKYVDGLTATTRWHRGRCLSYGDGVAFWALAEAVRARFGLLESDSGDTITERLDAGLAQYIANADERDWLRPRLTVLLGVDAAASFTRDDLFAAWTGFLEHLSDDGSAVVLVIDDAQYADDGLLDFLDHLLATTRSPMAVILLARPELLARRPDIGGRKTTVVRLEPLDAPVMAALIDGLVDGLPEAPRAALVERADGIPLFAVETVRALIDRDLVVPRDGRYVVAAGAELDLDAIGAPASLQALVAARLDALTPNEKRVITDASVLGLTFTRDGLLAFDPGSDPVGVDAALASLTRKELFAINTDRFSAERGQYRFVQSVVRQVAYGTQSKRDRKARHLAAAEHLETLPDPGDDVAVVIASHLLDAIAASPATDPDISTLEQRAVDELERATARARRVGAPAEALRLAELALTHSREAAAQARLHLAAAQAAAEADLHELATEHAVLATALFDDLDDPISAGHAVAAHAEAFLLQGDNAAATAIASPRLEALTTVTGSESAQLVLSRRLGAAARQVGDWDAYSRHADRAVILAESLDDQADFASAVLRVGGFYFMTGAPRMARIAVLAGAALAREHDLPEVLTTALSFLSAVENSRDLPTALRSAREGLEVSRRTGVRRDHELAVVNLLVGLWTAGNIEEFRRLLEDNPDDLIDPTFLWFVRTCRAWTADAQGRPLGELADQLTALDAREDPGTDSQPALAWQESARITVALDQGDPASAARVASISIEHVLAGMGIDDDFHLLIPPLVHAALAHHDVDLADRLLEPVTTALPGKRSPAVSAQWHRLRGLVAAERGTDPEFAETEMRTGITALDAFGAVGYRAQAQEELARWLVDQHRPEDAAPLIDAARTTYTEIGATGWLAKLDAWDTSRHSIVAP